MKITSGPIIDMALTETPSSIPSGMVLGTTIEVQGVSKGTGEFIFALSNGILTAGDVGVSNAGSYDFKTVVQADADDFDPMLAVAVATTADNDYCLLCTKHHEGTTYGSGTTAGIKTLASAAADGVLYVSSTAGELTSTATTTQTAVDGVRLKTATGTAAAAVNTTADYPFGMRFRDR